MADVTPRMNEPRPKDLKKRFKDMGDGTFAEVLAVALVGAAGVTLEVNEADLANVGAKADTPATDDTGAWSVVAMFKRMLQNGTTALGYLKNLGANPSVVTAAISAATAAPATVAGLVANSFITIAGGTVDAVTARIASIAGTATLAFYGTDDGINLFPLSGLPVGGAVGTGSLVNSSAATGAWSLKGSGVRNVYVIATAIAGGNVSASLSATPNQNRVTSLLRGSLGGAVSAAPGTAATEAVMVQNASPKAYTSSIANAGTLGGAINFGTQRPGRIVMPAAWTAANMSFDVSADGVTYGPLYDQNNSEVNFTSANVVAGRQVVLDPVVWNSVQYVKPRSGLNGATVAQGAQRDIVFVGV